MQQHQIVGLRDFVTKDGKPKKFDTFYDKNWNAPSISDIFKNPDSYVEKIPVEERHNIYFTVAECKGKREFVRQKDIPFDIDGIDRTQDKKTVGTALTALGLKFEETKSLFSGNGVQFFVELEKPFDDPRFFDENREYYKACCERINSALKIAELPGSADTSVFSLARLMRMPNTFNIKPNKPKSLALVLQANSRPLDFSLKSAAGIPEVEATDAIRKFPPPDTEAVLKGCLNLAKMLEAPEDVPEPLWYANASVIGRLGENEADGRRIWHEYSSKSAKYNAPEADRKLDQAMLSSGPRTCASMACLTGSECGKCPHNKKLKSPILIQGPDYIGTKTTGFHTMVQDANGHLRLGKPAYKDLYKFFEKKHRPVIQNESEEIFEFTGTHYESFPPSEVKAFADKWFTDCTSKKANEFLSEVERKALVKKDWFADTTNKKVNFKNGMLDIPTMKFTEGHSRDNGFKNVLPYAYDPEAQAPVFLAYIDQITCDDKELAQQLLEFCGYCLSNDDCWEHKTLILQGRMGDNSKSTFMELLKAMAENSYSTVAMRNIQDPQFIANMEGKLFNISEEATDALKQTDILKLLISGGEIDVKTVYQKPYKIRNRAKLVFACNELPTTSDLSGGFRRRLSIVPFEGHFSGEKKDPFLLEKLLIERSGIFNIMMAAYKEMRKRGYLFESTRSKELVAEYMENNDSLGEFIGDYLEILDTNSEEFSFNPDIYTAYVQYAESCGENPLPNQKFFTKLSDRTPGYKLRKTRKKKDGIVQRALIGVKLIKKGPF